ncbi:recombination mediator RecR [Devriesea agamarum]|uniref:recombination mediator RecR n=1 Tax=Devriesea agamarum TaxID=472569 RepID=UPI00071DE774|nr:recombination mediator RecR [Devriesea agamarum]
MYEGIVQDLIEEFGKLPGIGPKSAQRLAFHVLDTDATEIRKLADALISAKEKVRFCEVCGTFAQDNRCRICADARRTDDIICVVEESKDVVAIERLREFKGRYHVLGGAIDPIGGVGPNDLRIKELMARLGSGETREVILALDPNIEGEATASYISRLLAPMDIAVTRLASGLPVGGDLDYADELTLGRAFAGRRSV